VERITEGLVAAAAVDGRQPAERERQPKAACARRDAAQNNPREIVRQRNQRRLVSVDALALNYLGTRISRKFPTRPIGYHHFICSKMTFKNKQVQWGTLQRQDSKANYTPLTAARIT